MARCPERKRAYEKEYYHKVNKQKKIEQVTRWRKQKLYGLTEQDYADIKSHQNDCCKICGVHEDETHKGLHVDHCHTSGKVRGLLCYKCNTGLGQFNDNPDLLNNAKEYLLERTNFNS